MLKIQQVELSISRSDQWHQWAKEALGEAIRFIDIDPIAAMKHLSNAKDHLEQHINTKIEEE